MGEIQEVPKRTFEDIFFEGQRIRSCNSSYLNDPDFFKGFRFEIVSPTYFGSAGQYGFLVRDKSLEGIPFWMGGDLVYEPLEESKDVSGIVRVIGFPFSLLAKRRSGLDEAKSYEITMAKEFVGNRIQEQPVVINGDMINEYVLGEMSQMGFLGSDFLRSLVRVDKYFSHHLNDSLDSNVSFLEDCVKHVVSRIEKISS